VESTVLGLLKMSHLDSLLAKLPNVDEQEKEAL